MRANPLIMLFIAIVFGGGAIFATKLWLDSQHFVSAAEASVPKTTSIVVAATPLKFGDKLTKDNLREIEWPNGALPAGAFGTRAQLLNDKQGDRYVVSAMAANEPVLGSKITGPGQRATLSAVLDPGKKAMTIRVNDVLGVAGFVLPGDRVDILLTRTMRRASGDEQAYVDVLIQGVKVLAIDQIANDRTDNPRVAKAVTLEVDTEEAQKLTLAANIGQLSLALRNAASATAEATRRITISDLGGGTETALPGRPAEVPVVAAPNKPQFVTVSVIRGTDRHEYQVEAPR